MKSDKSRAFCGRVEVAGTREARRLIFQSPLGCTNRFYYKLGHANMAPSRPTIASRQTTLLDSFPKMQSSPKPAVSTSNPAHRISKQQRRPAIQRKTPAQSDKILTDVLIAIKPVHLANIVSRQKNHEYRKYRLGDDVTRLWLYETSEGGTGRSSITYVSLLE